MRTAFVTGSSGLIGYEMVAFLDGYITNLRRFRTDYPEWEVTVDLDAIFASFRLEGSEKPLLRTLPQRG